MAPAIGEWRDSDVTPRPHFAATLAAGRRGYANPGLLELAENPDHPGIARATALSLLAQPFGSHEARGLVAGLNDPDPLIRIAALRQLRTLPGEARLRLPGAALLSDAVRGVRIEAVSTYAGMMDLLPLELARAYAGAEREFRNAYGAIANRPEALVTLATFEVAEGDVAAALARYETALDIDPMAMAARVNLADTLRALGQEARAESVIREGLRLAEEDANLHHALGLSLIRSDRSDEALAELRLAAELAPDNARYAYVLGIALNSTSGPQDALQVLGDAHTRFDADFDIAMALATIRRDSADADGALEIAYELARRHPGNPGVLSLLRSLNAIP